MGLVIRQSFWGTGIAYTGVILGYVNTLLLMPYFMEIDQIGLIRLILSNVLLLAPMVAFGTQATIFKFYPNIVQERDLKHSFFTFQVLLILAAYSFLILIVLLGKSEIGAFFESRSAEYIDYILVTLIIIGFHAFFQYFEGICKSELNILLPSFLNDILLRFSLGVGVVAFGFQWIGIPGLARVLIGAYGLALVILVIYLYVSKDLRLSWQLPIREWRQKAFTFGKYAFLNRSTTAIISNLSGILIVSQLGLDANGIYTTCFYMAAIVELPSRSMNAIVVPLLSRAFESNDRKQLSDLYKKSSLNLLIVGCLLLIGIISSMMDLFALIPKGDVFATGFWVVVIAGIGKIARMTLGTSSTMLAFSPYFRLGLWINLIYSFLTILGYYHFVPRYGIVGAAIVFAVITLASDLTRMFLVYSKVHIHPLTIRHLIILVLAVLTCLGALALPLELGPFLRILVRSGMITVLFSGIIFLLRLSPDLNDLVMKMVKILANRVRK